MRNNRNSVKEILLKGVYNLVKGISKVFKNSEKLCEGFNPSGISVLFTLLSPIF